eukprot:5664695-Prymnesium_polylepis.1
MAARTSKQVLMAAYTLPRAKSPPTAPGLSRDRSRSGVRWHRGRWRRRSSQTSPHRYYTSAPSSGARSTSPSRARFA